MTLKEATNVIQSDYVIISIDDGLDTPIDELEPIFSGGIYALQTITDLDAYSNYLVEALVVEDDVTLIKVKEAR